MSDIDAVNAGMSGLPLYREGPVLVTGGSGFIGTHLVEALIARGVQFVNLDIRPPALAHHRQYWRQGDLMDAETVRRVLTEVQPSLIYHLAAHASIYGEADQMQVNYVGVENIVDVFDVMPRQPLLVHASSQVVAGPSKGTFDPLHYEPQYGVYADSKVIAERYIQALPHRYHWVIVRPSVIWGPYHPSFPSQLWRYLRLRLYIHPRNFDVVRAYGYVGNVVHQLLRLAELPMAEIDRKTLYVGDPPLPSMRLLDALSQAFSGKPVRRVPYWLLKAAALAGEFSKRLGGPAPINLGRLDRMTSDFPIAMEPTFALLGPPPISIEQGVAETARWLKSSGS